MSPSLSQSPKQAPRELPVFAHSPESVNAFLVGDELVGIAVGGAIGWVDTVGRPDGDDVVGMIVGRAVGARVGPGVMVGAGVEVIVKVLTEPLVLVDHSCTNQSRRPSRGFRYRSTCLSTATQCAPRTRSGSHIPSPRL